ncbi:hypothetical protein BDV12DRAFT_189520 [Aspergillus spectabilis]
MSLMSPSKTTSTRRRRNLQACNTCRERRTKCDGQRPQCSFCLERGKYCFYLGMPEVPPSPLELEISMVWERLDQIIAALTTSSPRRGDSPPDQGGHGDPGDEFDMIRGFPYMTLQSESFMGFLGLEKSFSREIERMERSRFTSEFMHSMSNAFPPSPESCMALLALAIGMAIEDVSLVRSGAYSQGQTYVETAMEMLPSILTGDAEARSTQCLLLFSIYFLCRVQPCHAHDFLSMASNSLQSDIWNDYDGVEERPGILGNCYWISLLIESEIAVQLDIGTSGIWDLTPIAPPPSSCETWEMPVEISSLDQTSKIAFENSEFSSGVMGPDMSYFITEIALRKMLPRCTWSVRELSPGSFAYAPIIATELERQLDEWRKFLPQRHSFHDQKTEDISLMTSPEADFLRTQFYAFKASVYWPVLYQVYNTGDLASDLLNCCQFFEAYGAFVRSAARAVQVCRPNLWTLCTSVFTISMAALTGSAVPSLDPHIRPTFIPGLQLAVRILEDFRGTSPSLAKIGSVLKERASESLSSLY